LKAFGQSETCYDSYMSGERSFRISHQAVVIPKARRYFAGDTMGRIIRNTGVECVRRDEAWDSVHLAIEAVNQVLRMAAIDKTRIKHLVFVTQTPRHAFPANNNLLIEECKLWDAAGVDVVQGASGYMHGLYLLHRLMSKGEAGILVCADTMARRCRPGDVSTTFLYSDAASASLVQQGGEIPWEFDIASIPSKFDSMKEREGSLAVNTVDILQAAASLVPKMLRPFLEIHSYAKDVYLHAETRTLFDMVARKLPDGRNYPCVLETYGNASMVTIPLTMALVRPTGHTIACGFGAGFHAVAGYLGNLGLMESRVVEV